MKWTDEGNVGLTAFREVSHGDHHIERTTAIAKMILLANGVGARLEVLHVQGRDQIRLVKAFRAEGYQFITEANPWSLFRIDPITVLGSEDDIRAKGSPCLGGPERWYH